MAAPVVVVVPVDVDVVGPVLVAARRVAVAGAGQVDRAALRAALVQTVVVVPAVKVAVPVVVTVAVVVAMVGQVRIVSRAILSRT